MHRRLPPPKLTREARGAPCLVQALPHDLCGPGQLHRLQLPDHRRGLMLSNDRSFPHVGGRTAECGADFFRVEDFRSRHTPTYGEIAHCSRWITRVCLPPQHARNLTADSTLVILRPGSRQLATASHLPSELVCSLYTDDESDIEMISPSPTREWSRCPAVMRSVLQLCVVMHLHFYIHRTIAFIPPTRPLVGAAR